DQCPPRRTFHAVERPDHQLLLANAFQLLYVVQRPIRLRDRNPRPLLNIGGTDYGVWSRVFAVRILPPRWIKDLEWRMRIERRGDMRNRLNVAIQPLGGMPGVIESVGHRQPSTRSGDSKL